MPSCHTSVFKSCFSHQIIWMNTSKLQSQSLTFLLPLNAKQWWIKQAFAFHHFHPSSSQDAKQSPLPYVHLDNLILIMMITLKKEKHTFLHTLCYDLHLAFSNIFGKLSSLGTNNFSFFSMLEHTLHLRTRIKPSSPAINIAHVYLVFHASWIF
jgi:hypothetical protein